jgi:type VI protein secretion system component VasK
VLDSASTGSFATARDAAARLQILSEPASPLLHMLSQIVEHVSVDSAASRPFQPVQLLANAASSDDRSTDLFQTYQGALAELAGAFAAMDRGGLESDGAASRASEGAIAADQSIRAIVTEFGSSATSAPIGTQVQRLLREPVNYARGTLGDVPIQQINALGQQFCTRYGPVFAKYPFRAGAADSATIDDINSLLGRDRGALIELVNELVDRGVVSLQGTGYRAAASAQRRPREAFLDALSAAWQFSSAAYSDTGAGPRVEFSVQVAVPQGATAAIIVDGQREVFTQINPGLKNLAWAGGGAREARLTISVPGQDIPIASGEGRWALFQMFRTSEWTPQESGRYRVRWAPPGRPEPIEAFVTMNRNVAPVFDPDFLDRIVCVPRIY